LLLTRKHTIDDEAVTSVIRACFKESSSLHISSWNI